MEELAAAGVVQSVRRRGLEGEAKDVTMVRYLLCRTPLIKLHRRSFVIFFCRGGCFLGTAVRMPLF